MKTQGVCIDLTLLFNVTRLIMFYANSITFYPFNRTN